MLRERGVGGGVECVWGWSACRVCCVCGACGLAGVVWAWLVVALYGAGRCVVCASAGMMCGVWWAGGWVDGWLMCDGGVRGVEGVWRLVGVDGGGGAGGGVGVGVA